MLCAFFLWPSPGRADVKSLAREAADYVLKRFGRQAIREGAETLARKIETLAVRHGEEAFQAIRRVGPRTFRVVEEAGVHANQAVRVMARHGEHGVTWILSRPQGMAIFLKHGDRAAATLVKHAGIAEPVIQHLGAPAIRALEAASPQAGRRLAMMFSSGELAKIGRTAEVLEVVGRYGDKALAFLWKHRAVLVTGTLLTAFLANPEPFLEGTRIVAENVVRPVAETPGRVLQEVAGKTNWTLLLLVIVLIAAGVVAIKLGCWRLFQQRIPLSHSGPTVTVAKNGTSHRQDAPFPPPGTTPTPPFSKKGGTHGG